MQERTIIRWIHIVGSIALSVFVYFPQREEHLALILSMQLLTVPALALTGLWLWQGHRIKRFLRSLWQKPENSLEEISSSAESIKRRFSPGNVWLKVSIMLGLLHHFDHVLRANHSGYPFTTEFSPFTWSLLVYPILFSAFWVKAPWYRVGAVTTVFLFTQLAHIFIETPAEQYLPWIEGENLLHLSSPVMGVYAVMLSLMLSATLITTLIVFVKAAWDDSATD
jgi:hypothetical protein